MRIAITDREKLLLLHFKLVRSDGFAGNVVRFERLISHRLMVSNYNFL